MIDSVLPFIVGLAICSSLWLWVGIAARWWHGHPLLLSVAEPTSSPPLLAVLAAVGWAGLNLFDQFLGGEPSPSVEPTPRLVYFAMAISLSVFVVLLTLLLAEGRWQPRDAGFHRRGWLSSLKLGVLTFLAAIAPTILAVLLSISFRSRETQHVMLRLLQDDPDPTLLLALGITAVVVAPLSEELLFRVTLQGWLVSICETRFAIPMVALVFSAIHGWRDGLALLPFALILGYVYDRRRDYLAVVVAHGSFNLANLILQVLATQAESG